jgi:hypothetical protein
MGRISTWQFDDFHLSLHIERDEVTGRSPLFMTNKRIHLKGAWSPIP